MTQQAASRGMAAMMPLVMAATMGADRMGGNTCMHQEESSELQNPSGEKLSDYDVRQKQGIIHPRRATQGLGMHARGQHI